jgi:hypothetical protein
MANSRFWPDWTFLKVDETLSILDILRWGEIDFKLAGLLWMLMERRASVIVASGPSWAGKTTLFHSLLDFLRPEINQVTLHGYYEDFKSLSNKKPETTYLITEEISNHQYEYLWGYQVVKAFALIPKGYALGGTIHARNIREVAYILNALRVPLPLIANLGVIITLQVTRGRTYDSEPIRYVDSVSTLDLTQDGLTAQILATRHLPDEKFVYSPEQSLQETLSHKFSIKYESISSEMELRGNILSQLYHAGSSREEVRKAIIKFYQSKNP